MSSVAAKVEDWMFQDPDWALALTNISDIMSNSELAIIVNLCMPFAKMIPIVNLVAFLGTGPAAIYFKYINFTEGLAL